MSAAVQGTSLTVPITATHDGDAVIIAVALAGTYTADVTTVTAANGQRLFRDAVGTTFGACDRTIELWSGRNIAADVTSIEVGLTSSATVGAYELEVSGLSAYPLVQTTNIGTSAPPTPDAPLFAEPGQLVLASFTTCGSLRGLKQGSTFVAFDPQLDSDLAYVIATASGSYAAQWNYDTGASDQYTLVYR